MTIPVPLFASFSRCVAALTNSAQKRCPWRLRELKCGQPGTWLRDFAASPNPDDAGDSPKFPGCNEIFPERSTGQTLGYPENTGRGCTESHPLLAMRSFAAA